MALYPYFLWFPISPDYIFFFSPCELKKEPIRAPFTIAFDCDRLLGVVVEPLPGFPGTWLRIAHLYAYHTYSPPFYHTADSYSAPPTLSPGWFGSGLIDINLLTFCL